jgi:hypothetical protein
LTAINRQMMYVHTFFIALATFLMGLLCLFFSKQLVNSELGKVISAGLFIFWLVKVIFQFFVYSSTLWKGKRLERMLHILISGFWIYISIVFFIVAFVR